MQELSRRIQHVATANPDGKWLFFAGEWHPWHGLAKQAAELRRHALPPSSPLRVGVVARNSPVSAAAIVATLMNAGTVVSLDAMMSDETINSEAARSRLSWLVAAPEDQSRLDPAGHPTAGVGTLGDPEHEDPVAIDLGTSGTTGPPKRFEMRYSQLEQSLLRTRQHIYGKRQFGDPTARQSMSIVHTPLSHVGGFYRLIDNVVEPRPTLLMAKFEPYEWADLVERFSIKVDGLNPTAIQMILNAGIAPGRLATLRAVRCGMASIADDVRDEFEGRYGAAVLRAYGATEFSGEVAGWTLAEYRKLKDDKKGSVGKLHDGVEARVIDEDSTVIGDPDAIALLQLKGPGIGTGHDWVTTTDLARIDGDGYLWILGRADSAINRGGFKIVPDQVTNVILKHPSVADAAVVGTTNERLGQVVAAAVVLRPGEAVSESELRQWCRDHLPHFMAPDVVVYVDHLPMTRSLKVDRKQVMSIIEGSLTEG